MILQETPAPVYKQLFVRTAGYLDRVMRMEDILE